MPLTRWAERRARVRTYREDNCVVVEIGDNGPGNFGGCASAYFLTFLTTKGVGEGTGLGLDTVQRIVKEAPGNIQVSSKPGDTRFQYGSRWQNHFSDSTDATHSDGNQRRNQ